MTDSEELRKHYESLWTNAIKSIGTGAVEIDPVLAARGADARRGLTVVMRPSKQVQENAALFLKDIRELEPDQYYYEPSEFHITFLSLFTATVDHHGYFARIEEYMDAVRRGLQPLSPFSISFAGITASPGALMIQGFTAVERLNAARDNLRRELTARGLFDGLDERYRLETAHMTVVRFREPLRDGHSLVEMLKQRRNQIYGETLIDSLELVKNDWYMSRANVEVIRRYKLT